MKLDRLKKIKYQLRKSTYPLYPSTTGTLPVITWSDRQLIEMAQSILDDLIQSTDVITDTSEFPASTLGGVGITWEGGSEVLFKKGSTELDDNLGDNTVPVVPLDEGMYLAVNGEPFVLSDGSNLLLK